MNWEQKADAAAARAVKKKGNGIAVDPLELDEVEQALAAPAAVAGKVHASMRAALTAVERLYKSGLTREALVVLIAEKCGRAPNGTRISTETVGKVLDALGRLDEYVVGP